MGDLFGFAGTVFRLEGFNPDGSTYERHPAAWTLARRRRTSSRAASLLPERPCGEPDDRRYGEERSRTNLQSGFGTSAASFSSRTPLDGASNDFHRDWHYQ